MVLTFRLTVTDNDGGQSFADTIVTVKNVNQLPTANPGLAQTVNEGATVTLPGSGTDPDGTIVSYLWTQTGGPATVNPSGYNSSTATFTAPQVSADTVLTFRLAVTDNDGGQSFADTTVTVKDVQPIDLIVTKLAASISTKGGVKLNVADQVKNQGTAAAGSFGVGFYLSIDTTLGAEDIYVCSRSLTGLAANTSNPTGTKTVTTSCAMPSAAVKGTKYYVIGVADYLKVVGETNEANNNKVTTTQVTIP